MDPVLQAIATALATSTARAVAARGHTAWNALVGLVRRRFQQEPAARDILDVASTDPTDTEKIATLTNELTRAEQRDPDFGRRLRQLWAQADGETRSESGSVTNQISGTVGSNAVQARDIGGGVAFGEQPGRDTGH